MVKKLPVCGGVEYVLGCKASLEIMQPEQVPAAVAIIQANLPPNVRDVLAAEIPEALAASGAGFPARRTSHSASKHI